MATTKVSALSALTAPDGAEELLINDGGTSKKITITNVSKLNLKGGDLTSASPLVIDTDGNYFDVTGTTNFAAMTVAANRQFTLQFDGALTMTHHATNLDLPSEANITTAAGDVATFQSTGANTVQCINYTRADGTSISGSADATKLPLAGGEMSGNITMAGSQTVDGRDLSADGTKLDGIASSANNYTLPEANATTKGGIELFSNTDQSVAAESVSTTANRTYGLQLNSDGQGVVNVPWADTDTNTTYSAGSSSALGLIKLEDDNVQTTAASAITTTAARTYGLQVNSSGQGVVNVPWADTDTNTNQLTTFTVSATTDTNATTISQGDDLMFTAGSGITQETTADGTVTTTLDLTSDQAWTGSQRATLVTDNDGSFDLNAGQNFKCTPAGGLTLTFTNFANGQSGYIILVNSGGHAIARHSDTIADANFVSTVSAAGTYIISYISDGTDAFLTNSAIMA